MSLDPWDRRPRESDPAWQAFVAYRDSEIPRSIRRTAEQLAKSRQLVGRWSTEHDWQDRVAAWDLEQDRQRREAMAKENVEAGRRHAQIAAGALQAAAAVNLEWLDRLRKQGDLPQALKGMTFEDLSELMVKVNRTVPRLIVGERLARGMTTESVEHSGGIDVYRSKAEAMPDAELDAFLAGAAAGQSAADAAHAREQSEHEEEPVE
jgi:hypothetical protein